MIEINLVPDVKLELIKARRVRTGVISFAIIVSMAAGGIVALLALYTFGVQGVAQLTLNGQIDSESKKLQSVEDLSEMLTVQNQLAELQDTHDQKLVTSRLFTLMTKIVPEGDNKVQFSAIDVNAEEGTITLSAEAKNGYEALEVFKKTLAATKVTYTQDGQKEEVLVASDIQDIERNFGETEEGDRVLRFSVSFVYASEIFTADHENVEIVAPTRQNATDSKKGVPDTLFTDSTTGENN